MGETLSYNNLIAAVAKSSKYHKYEVADVLAHLTNVLQKELVKENSVRMVGLGKIKMQKLKTYEKINSQGEKVCYDSFRLSIVSDLTMKEYLKENYAYQS